MLEEKLRLEQKLKYLERGQFYWLGLLREFINGLNMPKKMLETDDFAEKRKFLENTGSNFTLGIAPRPRKNAPAGIENSNTESGLGGWTGKKTVPALKNMVYGKTDGLCLGVEFKNFWRVLEKENIAKNDEKEFCTIWRRRTACLLRSR
ncbi:hypothetical protein NO1_0249 [Candidatus Termititenax aidoneus]|uniref:Uncharacterized protein n=1 Tax=Termititenax aidoneus TaxID=2218524 RepID=A0A388T8B9_TERA1|nr:hypothetical protein NO1_0249 [Candidatus Termititenax aidoneus]